MSIIIVIDSDEEYICKKGEVITTMIPNPIGLESWYGEEQAAQVKREAPWDFTGPIPSPNGKVIAPLSPKVKVREDINGPTTPATVLQQKAE